MPITQKKKIYKILAFGLAIALPSTLGLSSKGPPKKKPHRQSSQVYSVTLGRFNLDIPESMELADIALNKDAPPIKVYFDYIKPRAEQLINSSLATIKNNEVGRKTIEKPAEILQPSDDTWLIAYNHKRLTGVDVYGKPMDEVSNSSLGFV
ncbi:hypothetical protein [Pseudomonas viridiflava]|uniref:Uncharacterized protein n=1 Tax=Pseudomonas viridiflava TaxID=33069 RepID=A0A3M5NXI3_PSEVI|nr:hypothetical protein [Pseudomonas viridiflava]RMT77150.1 hypothetical protein ALP40_200056 [Pseudomonas viridiflava]